MSLTQEVERYRAESRDLAREGHVKKLKSIGGILDTALPSEVGDTELKHLEYALGNLKKTMSKNEDTRDSQIAAINSLLAKVSYLSQKKPNRRTERMILDILNLGKQLLDLAEILSQVIVPFILQQLIDQTLLN